MRRLINRLDRRYTKICLYASVTVLLTIAASMVLYFSSGFFVNLWTLICAVLEPAVYGALIAYLLNPAVTRISHAVKNRGWLYENYQARRLIGILCCLLFLLALATAVLLVLLALIGRGLKDLDIVSIGDYIMQTESDLRGLIASVEAMISDAEIVPVDTPQAGPSVSTMLMGAFRGAANIGSTVFFSLVFSIYYLMDGAHVGGYVVRVLRAVVGKNTCDRIIGILADADHVFSGYIRGQFTDAFVVGVLASVVLTVVGVPFGPLVGLLTGLGNLIPYVGAPLGIVTTILVCLAQAQTDKIVAGIVCLCAIMFIDSNVINPKLLSDNVEVHPLLVVAALIAGGAVGGLAGMLVAVPTAALGKIYLDRWLATREANPEGADGADPARDADA